MNWDERNCPSWTGGVAVPKRKYCEATTVGTDGVVDQSRTKLFEQPPRPLLVDSSRLLLMSRPPRLARRGNGVLPDFSHLPSSPKHLPRINFITSEIADFGSSSA